MAGAEDHAENAIRNAELGVPTRSAARRPDPLESLAASVIELTHKIEHLACDEHLQKLCDAAIAQQVRAALMAHPKIGEAPVEVSCRTGVVTLSGPSLVPPWNSLVESVARSVLGVVSVEIAAEEPPIPQRTG